MSTVMSSRVKVIVLTILVLSLPDIEAGIWQCEYGSSLGDIYGALRAVPGMQAAGFPVSSKESSRDVCRKLWQKALTTAGELGIPDDALASQPPSLRRMLRTHHLLGLEHVQTLYLLATEVQRSVSHRLRDVMWTCHASALVEVS